MSDLYPTPTRLQLLRDVQAERVFQDRIGDSYIIAERKVNYAIAELKVAGWVQLVDRHNGALPIWTLTDAGRAVLDGAS